MNGGHRVHLMKDFVESVEHALSVECLPYTSDEVKRAITMRFRDESREFCADSVDIAMVCDIIRSMH